MLPHTVVCQGARKATRRYPRRFVEEFAASGLDMADLAAFAAAWRARATAPHGDGRCAAPHPGCSGAFAACWRELAACRGADLGLFFPERRETAGPARQVCVACPVRQPCLDYAISNRITHGIWGG